LLVFFYANISSYGAMMKIKRTVVMLVAVIPLLLCACSSQDPEIGTIRGMVVLEEPVANADVDIIPSPFGNPNLMAPIATVQTGDMGAFLYLDSYVPQNFRIQVENGRYGDRQLEGRLIADVRNFNPETDVVHVNLVTTLLGTYLERHSRISFEEAKIIIRNFLDIPEYVNISNRIETQYFSDVVFMDEADYNGGLDYFMETLVAEIESDPSAVHRFLSFSTFTETISDFVSNIGGQITDKALSMVTDQAFGWILGNLGLGGPDLADVLKELDEISSKIDGLSTQLDEIYYKLSAQINQSEYNTLKGQLDSLVNAIRSTYGRLEFLANYDGEDEAWMAGEKESILGVIDRDILPQALAIHNKLYAGGGEEGLIKIWSRVVKNKHRFLNWKDSKNMQDQFDYFDVVQLCQLDLIIEYYHATNAPDAVIQKAIDQYNANREKQLALVPWPIPDKAIIETHTGLMIYPWNIWRDHDIVKPTSSSRPQPYSNSMSHSYYDVFFWRNRDYSYNVNKVLGFSNWRMPTLAEGREMIAGWNGAGVGTWAIAQGYPKDYIVDRMWVYLNEYRNRPGAVPGLNFYYIWTINGKISRDNRYESYPGYTGQNGRLDGHMIPVRSLQEEEFYYW